MCVIFSGLSPPFDFCDFLDLVNLRLPIYLGTQILYFSICYKFQIFITAMITDWIMIKSK